MALGTDFLNPAPAEFSADQALQIILGLPRIDEMLLKCRNGHDLAKFLTVADCHF